MPPAAADTPVNLTPPVLDFIEKISQHYEIVYSLPRIGCRILALLLLVSKPLSMQAMERILRVSHASISTNLRLLHAMGYVHRDTFPGDRTTYFHFLPRSRVRTLQDRVDHYQDLKRDIEDARHNLELEPDVTQHLEEMEAWADLAIKMNSGFIAEWQEYVRKVIPSSDRD